jgi:hypothetical protein
MSRRMLFCLVLACSMTGCLRPQFVRTGAADMVGPAVAKDSVEIYRSTVPVWDYEEIGFVSVKDISNLALLFDLFRTEAALRGAGAVINFDLDSASQSELVTRETTDPDGTTHSYTELERAVSHIASGTLVRKK